MTATQKRAGSPGRGRRFRLEGQTPGRRRTGRGCRGGPCARCGRRRGLTQQRHEAEVGQLGHQAVVEPDVLGAQEAVVPDERSLHHPVQLQAGGEASTCSAASRRRSREGDCGQPAGAGPAWRNCGQGHPKPTTAQEGQATARAGWERGQTSMRCIRGTRMQRREQARRGTTPARALSA